jgi:penicillin-binding protein 1A
MEIKTFRKQNVIFWAIFASPLFIVALLFILAAMGKLGYMPKTDDLQNPKINLATLIISEDNQVLGSLYTQNQNRTFVEYEKLPKNLVESLLASEDIRFYKHSGIDFKGSLRAVMLLGSRGGGSTITQQLAKQLFHKPAQNLFQRVMQKFKEYIIAVKLEKSYTKNEIVALYFNQFDFLYNAVGIHSASQIYFNKLPDSLRVEESAVLVGMAQNPALFNPVLHPDKALKKRNLVLSQLFKYDFITKQQCDSLSLIPIKLDFQPASHNVGPATYFREYIKQFMTYDKPVRKNYNNYAQYKKDSTQWVNDPLFGWCNKNKKSDGTPYDIYTDGLRIYTTVNYKMQLYAEEAVKAHLGGYLQNEFFKEKKGRRRAPFAASLSDEEIDRILKHAIRWSDRGQMLYNQGKSMDEIYKEFKKPVPMKVFTWNGDRDTIMSPLDSILYYKHFLRTGFMAMDPHTGFVKAYVGGINFRHFKYDQVTQGKRQAGSTFKPFLYILAMQEGYSPCDEVPVVPVRFRINDTIWEPHSTCKKEFLGTLKPLKWGLAMSENYISAYLVSVFKPQPIADIAYKMGIESHIDPVPSMIYGTSDMSVKEMVGAYCTFANKGVHTDPIFVTRIEDKFGNVLATFQPESKEAISEETAYLMLNLMEGVIDFGTAARLRYKYKFTGDMAGKTGTTNNHSDGWFIGVTPNLVAGTWVGAEDRGVHFDNIAMGSGTSMALPIFAEFMQRVYADPTLNVKQTDIFEKPVGVTINLDCGGKQKLIDEYLDPYNDYDIGDDEEITDY